MQETVWKDFPKILVGTPEERARAKEDALSRIADAKAAEEEEEERLLTDEAP